MQTTINMTRSWQVYIPEQIRKSMGIDAPTLFEATVKDNSLVLKPTKSRFLELGGALNKYHKKNLLKAYTFRKISLYKLHWG